MQSLVEEIVVIDSQHGQPLQFGELCYNHSIRVPCTSSKAFARGTCITNTLVNGRDMGCLPVLRIVSMSYPVSQSALQGFTVPVHTQFSPDSR